MSKTRVVITGMGAVSPFGEGREALWNGLKEGRSAVICDPELENVQGMRSRVCAKVPADLNIRQVPRKFRRSMSRMSIFSLLSCYEALAQAGMDKDGDTTKTLGISIGCTIGSPEAMQNFFESYLPDHTLEGQKSGFFFKVMNHSVASNMVMALGLTGRAISPSAACATSNQSIGLAYEMIAAGRVDGMLCGGADEVHALTTSTFDVLNAASVAFNDNPTATPRPFDSDRDGVVCSEGAGVVLIESLDSALAANRSPLAEIIGFATLSDPSNIAHPSPGAMHRCMQEALTDARLQTSEIDYINAHATGTEHGDLAESEAIATLFGDNVPVSSLKGHLGHTMAASGSLELIASLLMMHHGILVPTRNLDRPDDRCQDINLIRYPVKKNIDTMMKNSFAFGGVNSSLIVRKYRDD
jgi:3-oxoacyl-[acyl-carrier-protein] synthase II